MLFKHNKKEIEYTNNTVFLVQIYSDIEKQYKTLYKFQGDPAQAVEYYEDIKTLDDNIQKRIFAQDENGGQVFIEKKIFKPEAQELAVNHVEVIETNETLTEKELNTEVLQGFEKRLIMSATDNMHEIEFFENRLDELKIAYTLVNCFKKTKKACQWLGYSLLVRKENMMRYNKYN